MGALLLVVLFFQFKSKKYIPSIYIFGGLITVVTIAYFAVKRILAVEHKLQFMYAVLAFWLAYILTRPLGASIGDYLSQARADGGLGLGATATSVIFLVTILGLVVYLTLTRKDEIPTEVAQILLSLDEHFYGFFMAF